MRCFCLCCSVAAFVQQKKALLNISIFRDYSMWKHSPAFCRPTITIITTITTSSLGNNSDDGNFTNWPDNIHYVFSFSPPFQRNVIGRSSVFPFPLFVQPHTHNCKRKWYWNFANERFQCRIPLFRLIYFHGDTKLSLFTRLSLSQHDFHFQFNIFSVLCSMRSDRKREQERERTNKEQKDAFDE